MENSAKKLRADEQISSDINKFVVRHQMMHTSPSIAKTKTNAQLVSHVKLVRRSVEGLRLRRLQSNQNKHHSFQQIP